MLVFEPYIKQTVAGASIYATELARMHNDLRLVICGYKKIPKIIFYRVY